MNEAAWERLVDLVDLKFGITDHGRRTEPLEDRPDLTQQVAFINFEIKGTAYRLERASRPSIAEKKSIYHRAAGSGVRFENVYDTQQMTHKVTLFTQRDGGWQSVDLDQLAL